MDRAALTAFSDRSRAILESEPPTTLSQTKRFLVEPLLEVLGWEVAGPACDQDVELTTMDVDYCFSVSDTPALFVVVEALEAELSAQRREAIETALKETGVDRAIYTSGRSLVLFSGTDPVERVDCPVTSLPEHVDTLEQFSRGALTTHLERHSRSHVARSVAVEHERLTEELVASLAAVVGDSYQGELEGAVRRFLDQLTDTFRPDDPAPTPSPEPADAPPESAPVDEGNQADTPEPSPTVSPSAAGEFVVKFFGDRGSVGGVGGDSPEMALISAAEFLFERGLSGLTLPWECNGTVVITEGPVHPDGSPLTEGGSLSNGLFVNTSGGPREQAERIEALTEVAGLRVMLTGDWETDS